MFIYSWADNLRLNPALTVWAAHIMTGRKVYERLSEKINVIVKICEFIFSERDLAKLRMIAFPDVHGLVYGIYIFFPRALHEHWFPDKP